MSICRMLFCVVVAVSGAAFAVEAMPAKAQKTSSQESLIEPVPNVRYQKKPGPYKACVARVAAAKGRPCDLIFIGDSITERWLGPGKGIWEIRYATRNALNFGCFADTTQNVLWRFDHLDLKGLNPKVAVILIGTNNNKNQPVEIAAGVKAVVAKAQGAFPGVKVILVSIMPNQRAFDTMMTANSLIKELADERTIFWLDLVPLMTPVATTLPDGDMVHGWKGIDRDQLHPDTSGYQLWGDAMEPLLSRLLPDGVR